jgi:predicted metalloprotease with PDZ domain
VPASPGPLTLVYPQWLPGEHGPTGPIADLVLVKVAAGGETLAWRRDPVEMTQFLVDVPAGADALEVDLDFLSPAETGGFTSGSSATANLALLSWNQMLLFPKGRSSDELTYAASLRLPAGWKYGVALPVTNETPEKIEFAPVSLTTLVDAPLLAGSHFKTIELSAGATPHRIHIAADSDAALAAPPAVVTAWKRLVGETGALFGARHYGSYSFLLTLSDHTAHFGLEHHESSDNRVAERTLIDDDERRTSADLLAHEMTHSWNGKYRRPAGLQPGSFEKPMHGDLLWVYEGLTQYLGEVLAARSGLWTLDEYRDSLAITAATMDLQGGRAWRPLQDTTTAAQILYPARADGTAWRRSVDFYPEGALLWLEADALIRRESAGAKSLDDFCRLFHGGESGPPRVVTYTFDDVVAALQRVVPYDWRGFWRSRLDALGPRAPLGGLAASGWKLAFTDKLPKMQESTEERRKLVDERYSIGFVVNKQDSLIPDVVPDSAAAQAGVGPGMKLLAVNGRRWSRDTLRDAIRETQTLGRPLELLVENGEFVRTHRLDYDGGLRYPHLEPDPGQADVLTQILQPLAPPPAP